MNISDKRLKEFIELYKEVGGVELSRAEAHEKATLLLEYVMMCMKPLNNTAEELQ